MKVCGDQQVKMPGSVLPGGPRLGADVDSLAEALLAAWNTQYSGNAESFLPSSSMPPVADFRPPPGLPPPGLPPPGLPGLSPVPFLPGAALPTSTEEVSHSLSMSGEKMNSRRLTWPVHEEVGVAINLDPDGIARLVPPGGSTLTVDASAPSQPKRRHRCWSSPASPPQDDAIESAPAIRSACSSSCRHGSGKLITHSSTDGITLKERVRAALETSESLVVDIASDAVETEPLEISRGEVLLRGPVADISAPDSEAVKVRLQLPGLRVTGGCLCVQRLAVYATEDNRVQAGQLRCTDCFITSRSGCGILCLQKARVFLTDCKVAHCMRSGVGVNGKNTEIELTGCTISQNNFSGIGVNHQARSIILRDNRIVDNCYHGVWLNTGVVVHWLDGEIAGNKLTCKDGPGELRGYD